MTLRTRLDPKVINSHIKPLPRSEGTRTVFKRDLRKAKNSFDRWLIMCELTRQDAASLLGCSIGMVNQYALGLRRPRTPMRVMMSVIFAGRYGEFEPWPV